MTKCIDCTGTGELTRDCMNCHGEGGCGNCDKESGSFTYECIKCDGKGVNDE